MNKDPDGNKPSDAHDGYLRRCYAILDFLRERQSAPPEAQPVIDFLITNTIRSIRLPVSRGELVSINGDADDHASD